jgi:hypothetical protein
MGIEVLALASVEGRQQLTELNIDGCLKLTCQCIEYLKLFADLDVVGSWSVKNY